jgi:enediyne biosynthesis protein E4
VALGDYLSSGRLSVFVTNFSEEYNDLYRHDGDHFTDVSFRSKTAPSSLPYVGWGTAFVDYDNDGLLDIMVVNGHVYPQLDTVRLGASARYRQRKLLYHNRGDGTFEEMAGQIGPVMTDPRVGRGLAVGDLDNDGRLDVVVNNLDGSPEVLRNELPDHGNWLLVKLMGKGWNTDAIGALVTVRAGTMTGTRLVQSGTSYLSQHDMRLHFGLGAATEVDSLEVRWPDGTTTTVQHVKANQIVNIQQPR